MRCRPWLLRVLVGLPVFGLAGYAVAAMWQTWLGPRVRDYLDRQQASADERRRWDRHRAATGVVGELATGCIGPGDSLAGVVARFPPAFVHPYRHFTRVGFDDPAWPVETGQEVWVEVTVLDGRLVAATWCLRSRTRSGHRHWFGDDTFFDTTNPAVQAAYLAEQRAFFDAVRDTRMAAAGAAGYTGFHDPPR